eukprot:1728100-Rhodomonas_salina.6
MALGSWHGWHALGPVMSFQVPEGHGSQPPEGTCWFPTSHVQFSGWVLWRGEKGAEAGHGVQEPLLGADLKVFSGHGKHRSRSPSTNPRGHEQFRTEVLEGGEPMSGLGQTAQV